MVSKTELIRLQKRHGADPGIADALCITRQAVHQARVKHGIPAIPDHQEIRNKKIVALRRKGKTGIEIAGLFGLSVSQTYRVIRRCA